MFDISYTVSIQRYTTSMCVLPHTMRIGILSLFKCYDMLSEHLGCLVYLRNIVPCLQTPKLRKYLDYLTRFPWMVMKMKTKVKMNNTMMILIMIMMIVMMMILIMIMMIVMMLMIILT